MFLEKPHSKFLVLLMETPGDVPCFRVRYGHGGQGGRWPLGNCGGGQGCDSDLGNAQVSSTISPPPERVLKESAFWKKKYVSKRILKIQNCIGFLISSLLFSIYIWIANRTRWHEIFGASSPAVLTQPALYRSTRPQFFLLKHCTPTSSLKQSHPQPTQQRAVGHADFLWHVPPSRGWPWYFHGPSAVESAGSWWREEKRKVHRDFPCCPE